MVRPPATIFILTALLGRFLPKLKGSAAPSADPFLQMHQSSGKPPWHAWYNTAEWRRLRRQVFIRDQFQCQCGCGVIEGNTSQLVADHKIPHRGDPKLFWDFDNLQTLLKPCHDSKKQREEQASLHTRGIWH